MADTKRFTPGWGGGIIIDREEAAARKRFVPGEGAIIELATAGSQSFEYTATGGMSFAGAAVVNRVAAIAAAGGLSFAGAAVVTRLTSWTPAGGCLFSGASDVAYHEAVRTVVASGGLSFGGASGVSFFSVLGGKQPVCGRLPIGRIYIRQPN